jgi:hypothetical protein
MTGIRCRIALLVLCCVSLHALGQGGGAADPLVEGILEELRLLPPTLGKGAGDKKEEKKPAFEAKALAAYKPDKYTSVAQLRDRFQKFPKVFAQNNPLRAAFFEAVQVLEASQKLPLVATLDRPIQQKQKAEILDKQHRVGRVIFDLEQQLSRMKEAEEERDKEKSKRWQANFDVAVARLEARLVHLLEYDFVLAQVRSDSLPELSGKQKGWRLGPRPTLSGGEAKAKQLFKSVARRWKKIEENYPETPWAVLAQRESKLALGLEWRARKE